ncbi:hypothetical protein KFU94_08930 [Chloroflexi bacterium TSY]|nr:hypothetical protein [Chloroflexi bacterium TSY]
MTTDAAHHKPGYIILMGSGETSPSIRKVYDWLFQEIGPSIDVAILETPAGFEPNSDYVAGQIGQYLEKHLQNYNPQIHIVPARKRGTPFSPDNPDLIKPMYSANVLMMGPGSPTYAARQLKDSVVWHTLQARHRQGASLILASATTIASSVHALPVSVDPNLAFLAIFSRDCRDFGVIYSDFGYRKQPISYLKIAQI